jgi:hypothetical protein
MDLTAQLDWHTSILRLTFCEHGCNLQFFPFFLEIKDGRQSFNFKYSKYISHPNLEPVTSQFPYGADTLVTGLKAKY